MRKGQQPELGISFWNNPQEKNTLLLVTALHSKSSAFPSFLMTFPDHLMLFDYFCNVFFFFLPFLQVLFGSLHKCYVSRELFWKEQLFVHLRLRTPSNKITWSKVARIYIFSIGNVSFVFFFCFCCFVRFFLLASRCQKKSNICFWLLLWFSLFCNHFDTNIVLSLLTKGGVG